MRFRYAPHPHPHLVVEEIVEPEVYRRLRFPDHLIDPSREWGLTPGDAGYADLMADPDWASVRESVASARSVHAVLDAFAGDLARTGCLVDPARAHLDDFVESRQEKERPTLARHGDTNALFTRFDFQSKGAEYRPFVHVDWDRRVTSAILFFCDADEEGLEGGELALYRDRSFRNDRRCHDPELTMRFAPRHNTGVVFLNSNTGFHGPTAIRRLHGRRRWVSFAVSSRVDVWPHRRTLRVRSVAARALRGARLPARRSPTPRR